MAAFHLLGLLLGAEVVVVGVGRFGGWLALAASDFLELVYYQTWRMVALAFLHYF